MLAKRKIRTGKIANLLAASAQVERAAILKRT